MASESFTHEKAFQLSEVLSLRNRASRQKAAGLAVEGIPFGAYNRGVCAIWGDGANQRFVDGVADIKGEDRLTRPLAASLTTEEFVQLLDQSKIPAKLHSTILVARELASRTSSLCFIRGPITPEAAAKLPPSIVSTVDGTPVVQNWDAKGHTPTYRLLNAMRDAGIKYPAVTSMNVSGEPEIVDQEEGKRFSQERRIPLFLEDPRDPHVAVGSYTILGVSDAGLKLIREGNIPSALLKELLDSEIDTSEATTAKSLQPLEFSPDMIQGANPRTARIAILSTLRDFHPVVTKAILKAGKLNRNFT